MNEKCAKQSKFNFFVADFHEPSVREALQCQINAIGEASTANAMANEWNEYGSKFKKHLDAWKQCVNADGKLKKILYVLPTEIDF